MALTDKEFERTMKALATICKEDPILAQLMTEYNESERLLGVRDESIILKIFDRLDNQLQETIRKEESCNK